MYFSDKVISRAFRSRLLQSYPKLGSNTAYWRMLQYVLFGHWRDEGDEEQLLLVPRQLLAAIEGKCCDSNYSGKKFLSAFRRDVLAFRIIEHQHHWDPWLSKSRRIANFEIDEEIAALSKLERRSLDADRVWMSSGNKYLYKHGIQQRDEQRQSANELLAQSSHTPDSVTAMLIAYMNGLAPNRFTSSKRHVASAIELADSLGVHEYQYNILMSLRTQPQPLYMPALRSVRIFSANESMLRLKRDLRKILTQDWIDADLKSAQLAIVAKIWPVPGLSDYLRSGKSIWRDLCMHMDKPFSDENKSALKSAMYALIFGALKNTMLDCLRDLPGTTDPEAAYKRFQRHSVISQLSKARSRQLRLIKEQKGACDAFGRFLEFDPAHINNPRFEMSNARSIMARVAQSYELRLLAPVIEEAVKQQGMSHGFQITTWLHDGFTFAPHHPSDGERWKRQLRGLVAQQAKALAIETELEI